ncbi:MAG TPA: RNA polymerase subunit sigma-24, partial [Proteobacteria bacterium]|nr:RNA polymerase subunit sigma-24 [Pseudomonadota bacterium]
HNEIAKILSCSQGTVRSRLHYARELLQKELLEWI